MWIDLEALTDVEEGYITSVGRALMVAQHFEANCKDFSIWWIGLGALEDGAAKSLSDFQSISEAITQLMLGGLLNRLGADRDITKAEIALLVRAKDARNYIAHEAVAAVSFTSRFALRRYDELHEFKEAVCALVAGDNLISSWSYMFHEQEPSPARQFAEYPDRVVKWILAPLESTVNPPKSQ